MKYKIYAALSEDINSGWVWINPPLFEQRRVVAIINNENNKKVFCESLQVEKNFLKKYNDSADRRKIIESDPVLIINEWYRKLLGLNTNLTYDLEIRNCDNLYGKIIACFHHPQIVVRIATWLGFISVILGMLGIILGLISIW